MLSILDRLYEINLLSVTIRLVLAVLCGGIIGIERTYKRRPAGFRTHILICLGAAMTTLTSQYLYLVLHYFTDMARLGAQVVAGIGFIGAGTIIVTRGQRVKGLTTAAGLWASAIVGLALGAGFYEGGILTTLLILVAESVFAKVEYRMLERSPEVNLYISYTDKPCLDAILKLCRDIDIKILNLQITRPTDSKEHYPFAILNLRLHKHCKIDYLINRISSVDGVMSVEEL